MAFSYKWEIFNLIFACKSSRAMILAACFYHVVLLPSPHIIPIFTLVCIEIITWIIERIMTLKVINMEMSSSHSLRCCFRVWGLREKHKYLFLVPQTLRFPILLRLNQRKKGDYCRNNFSLLIKLLS